MKLTHGLRPIFIQCKDDCMRVKSLVKGIALAEAYAVMLTAMLLKTG